MKRAAVVCALIIGALVSAVPAASTASVADGGVPHCCP
jgi:hypothetical protein